MEYTGGKCPSCQKEFMIPEDIKEVICIYCGNVFLRNQPGTAGEETEEACREYREKLMSAFPDILLKSNFNLKDFKRGSYETVFQELYISHEPLLRQAEYVFCHGSRAEQDMQELASVFVRRAESELAEIKSKPERERRKMDYNMMMAVYVIPQILKYESKYSAPLADYLIAAWNQAFPKTHLGKAGFEEINAGFRKKLCYVTTAVCNSLGKADDCPELKLLRYFRDDILKAQPDGQEIIRRYYDIAPTIVKRIDKRAEKNRIYHHIYEEYIKPCMDYIRSGNYKECQKVYQVMVESLEEEYMR